MVSVCMVSVCRPVCVSRQTLKTSQGLCLMQDGATSNTAHTADFEPLQAHRVDVLPWSSKSPDLNPIKHNWDVIGRVVRRRCLTNIRQFTCTAICNGQMERNYTSR